MSVLVAQIISVRRRTLLASGQFVLFLIVALGVSRACFRSAIADDEPAAESTSSTAIAPLAFDGQPADSMMMVTLRPNRLFQREGLKIVDRYINSVGSGLRNPVSIRQLEQITFVRLKPDPDRPEQSGGGTYLVFDLNIFRTTVPIDWPTKLADYPGKPQEERYLDTIYYSLPDEPNICFWLIDERTYVVGNESNLKRAIDARRANESPPWKSSLEQVPEALLALAVNAEFGRTEFTRLSTGLGDQRLLTSLMKTLLTKATSMSLAGSGSDRMQLDAILSYEDSDTAERSTESVKALMALVRSNREQLVGAQIRSLSSDKKRVEQFSSVSKQLLDGARVAQRETDVVLGMNADLSLSMAMPAVIQAVGSVAGISGVPVDELFAATEDKRPQHVVPAGVLNSPAMVARRARSVNSMRQVAVAMHVHHANFDTFPPRAIVDSEGKPLLSWRVAILPYLDEQELYDQFHLDEPWDSEHNRTLLEKMPSVYAGPLEASEDVQRTEATLFVIVGPRTCFPPTSGASMAQISDGTTNTLLFVESKRDIPWTKPEDIALGDDGYPTGLLGGCHPQGFHVVMADGAIYFVADQDAREQLPALLQIDDGAEPAAQAKEAVSGEN